MAITKVCSNYIGTMMRTKSMNRLPYRKWDTFVASIYIG
jgi:hypothetical protein